MSTALSAHSTRNQGQQTNQAQEQGQLVATESGVFDHRADAVAQRQRQAMVGNSSATRQLQAQRAMIMNSPRTAALQGKQDLATQANLKSVQRQSNPGLVSLPINHQAGSGAQLRAIGESPGEKTNPVATVPAAQPTPASQAKAATPTKVVALAPPSAVSKPPIHTPAPAAVQRRSTPAMPKPGLEAREDEGLEPETEAAGALGAAQLLTPENAASSGRAVQLAQHSDTRFAAVHANAMPAQLRSIPHALVQAGIVQLAPGGSASASARGAGEKPGSAKLPAPAKQKNAPGAASAKQTPAKGAAPAPALSPQKPTSAPKEAVRLTPATAPAAHPEKLKLPEENDTAHTSGKKDRAKTAPSADKATVADIVKDPAKKSTDKGGNSKKADSKAADAKVVDTKGDPSEADNSKLKGAAAYASKLLKKAGSAIAGNIGQLAAQPGSGQASDTAIPDSGSPAAQPGADTEVAPLPVPQVAAPPVSANSATPDSNALQGTAQAAAATDGGAVVGNAAKAGGAAGVGSAGGMASTNAGAPAAGTVGSDGAGSAAIASGFIGLPPSQIARNLDKFGGQFNAGLKQDSSTLTATTPTVQADVNTQNIPAPAAPPVVAPVAAPQQGVWVPPVAALREDAPKFTPDAKANPQQAETAAAEKGVQGVAAGNQLNSEISAMPGPELVQGRNFKPQAQVAVAASQATMALTTPPEMAQYMNIDMPDSFRQQVDAASSGMFAQSLAAPRRQIEEASIKRDADHANAIQSASLQADQLGKTANLQQEQAIAASRAQIGTEKEKGLTESKATLDEYDGKVGREKQQQINAINQQIETHETMANNAMQDAENKGKEEHAKAMQKQAEEEAEARRKNEERRRNRSWWEAIGDFFNDLANAIADIAKSIVNTLASVVKTIVSAAKSLANSVIDACASLVKDMLNTFASVLKGFLAVALAAFPAIQARLNAAIDSAVAKANAAIDKVAATLNAAVNKLCDTMTNLIDFAQNFCVSMIEGGMMMFMAIITGNFDELPRIAFMTACNSLGLPGEELWKIVQKAADQAMEIIKDPGKFLGNLIDAGKKGFEQFVGNIKQHLMQGLMGWLFGQVGQTGLTLPETFDGPGIFSLIRQVLGVTYEYVRERAVGIVGEENVARAEAVFAYLKRLFTEGPGALWAELKERAAEMKDSFIEQIQDWAINTVIQKAVIKVTSMLIPGSGFVQAIYGMWQTIQFFIENIKKIAAVVDSLLDSLADISRGAIGAAANLVEQTMVDTLPLVFAWLAKLIGIDGIGEKIKGIIDKLRTPVNKAVDFVINGAMKLGKAAVNAVKGAVTSVANKLSSMWKGKKEFTTKDGELHAVYVEGEGKNARIVVNPVPKQDVADFLTRAEAKLPEAAEKKQAVLADIAKARTALRALKDDMGEIEAAEQKTEKTGNEATAAPAPASAKEQQAAEKELAGLAETLQRIMEATGEKLGSDADIQDMTPDQRKDGAMNEFITVMKSNKTMDGTEIKVELLKVKSKFSLSDAKLEGDTRDAKIGFYASPAQFLPVKLLAPIDGTRTKAVGTTALINKDYIKATHCDGPFDTPGTEVLTQLNNTFQNIDPATGQPYVPVPVGKKTLPGGGGHGPIGPIKAAALNMSTQKDNKQYDRAGSVMAQSSVPRGPRRSGNRETVFGHFGADEERILNGTHATNYNGGHLVGDQIMDSHNSFDLYKDWNLAPQQQSFNSPVYTSMMEGPITNAIKLGNIIEYEVTVQYPGNKYQKKPSDVIKNLKPGTANYTKGIDDAIAHNAGLDMPFTFTRRTPGYWKATATVVKVGGTIDSGNLKERKDAVYDGNPANTVDNKAYNPVAPEGVRFSLQTDLGGGAGLQPVPVPAATAPLTYAGATSVALTARQETF